MSVGLAGAAPGACCPGFPRIPARPRQGTSCRCPFPRHTSRCSVKSTEQRQAQSTPTPEDTTPPTVTPRAPAKGRTVPQRHVRALAPVPVRATVFGSGKRGLGGRDWLRAAREDGGPEGRTVAPRRGKRTRVARLQGQSRRGRRGGTGNRGAGKGEGPGSGAEPSTPARQGVRLERPPPPASVPHGANADTQNRAADTQNRAAPPPSADSARDCRRPHCTLPGRGPTCQEGQGTGHSAPESRPHACPSLAVQASCWLQDPRDVQ